MSYTVQSLADAAIILAGGLHKDAVADILIPRVIYYVYEKAAEDDDKRRLVLANSIIALTNGSATLPATVLVKYLKYSTLADPASATIAKQMRWVKDYNEFIRPLDSTLGYYTVLGTTLYMTRPGTAYTPGSGMTGNMTLTTPQVPDMSAWTASTTISVPGEIEDELLPTLARAIREGWMEVNPTKEAA